MSTAGARLIIASSVLCLVGACTGPAVPASVSSPTTSESPGTGSPSAMPSISFGPADASSPQTPTPSVGIGWTQVVGGADVLMMDVVAFPGGVVAVGGARGADRAPSPGLATSGTAGPGSCRTHVAAATCVGPVAWTYAADGSHQGVGPLGSEGGALQRVAWTGSSLIAIGCLGQPETTAGDCARPIVWVSSDGSTWMSAALPETPPGSTGIILRDVVALDGEVVVAGCLTEPDLETAQPLCSAAAVWRSTDEGRTWGPPELPDGRASTSQVMTLATDAELLVAAGFAAVPWEERIWTSSADADWSRADVELAGADSIDRVVPTAEGWLAIGSAVDDSPVWRSVDGRDWRLTDDMPGAERFDAVAVLESGLVVIGGVDGVPVVWTSRDGIAWDPAARDFSLQDAEVAVVGDRIVAVGREGIWVSDAVTPGLDIH